MDVHRNRQEVRHYGDSMIGRGHMREVAQEGMDNPLRQAEDPTTKQRFNPRNVNVPKRTTARQTPPRPSFREPPGREYNPYA